VGRRLWDAKQAHRPRRETLQVEVIGHDQL
jgi:hypothetical protein